MSDEIRHDWYFTELMDFFQMPFNDLILKSHLLYRKFFNQNEVQLSTLLNIKTGGCPENCRYCSQSAHYKTNLQKEKLVNIEVIKEAVKKAKIAGADRFCVAAAWRNLNDRDLSYIYEIIEVIKNEGLESCVSLGMIKLEQARGLKEAGLDFYNHNIDTSRDFYHNIVTTRTYDDRLESINNIQEAGINLCCGGILGMGESVEDRAKMLLTLANLKDHPLSVPINRLVPIIGTPLSNGDATSSKLSPEEHTIVEFANEPSDRIDNIDFIRTVAIARIVMPKSYIRLAAGRESMSEEMQTLCLFAGANSIFYGEKLLTTPNPKCNKDQNLLNKLGMTATV